MTDKIIKVRGEKSLEWNLKDEQQRKLIPGDGLSSNQVSHSDEQKGREKLASKCMIRRGQDAGCGVGSKNNQLKVASGHKGGGTGGGCQDCISRETETQRSNRRAAREGRQDTRERRVREESERGGSVAAFPWQSFTK